MAERIADNAEHIVDEMKRKARRRLVGAIVLALGAAIVLPLLLEKEPRPLGDDVSVQIPPIDENKFVNRLTGKTGESKALPKVESKAESKASAPPAKAENKPDASASGSTPSPAPAPAATAVDAPASKVEAKAAPTAEPKSDPKPAVATPNPAPAAPSQSPPAAAAISAAAPTAASATTPPPVASSAASSASAQGAAPATPAKAEGFVVQLAAFADDKGANSLANKLKRNGHAAFVEPIETSRGRLWRVRVGGFASKSEADAARVTLKGEGFNGIVAPAQ